MRKYDIPEFKILELDTDDVIATSGLVDSGDGEGDGSDFGEWGV